MKKQALLLLAGCAAVAALAAAALDTRLKSQTYRLESGKIASPVRLAVVSDLHSCRYGENQQTLLDAVRAAAPDAVLLPGDFYDDKFPEDNARIFAQAIAAEYPTYYVSGNHEIVSGRAKEMKEELRSFGVTVLEGDAVSLTVGESVLYLCGADDPSIGAETASAQRHDARNAVPEGAFCVLLSHRPELTKDYESLGFDLVVSGHAHGGQWRLPGLINGVYAPHQGIFPKYAGGLYELNGSTLIVSRGLARETTWVPRIFDRPELVVLDIQGKGGKALSSAES